MNIRSTHQKSLLIFAVLSLATIPLAGAAPQNPSSASAAHSKHEYQATPVSKPNSAVAPQVSTTMNLLGETNVLLDPACNACQGATVELRAHAHTTAADGEPLQLRVGHLVSDSGDAAANIKTTIEPADPKKPFPEKVKRGDVIAFRVVVTGVLNPGSWKTDIFNGDKVIGSVHYSLPSVSFKMRIDSGDTSSPSITLIRGEKSPLLLKNDDASGYQIAWEFVAGPNTLPVKNEGKITANGELPLPIEPKIEWFEEAGVDPCWPISKRLEGWSRVPCNWRAIFKDKDVEGILTVRLHSKDCPNDAGAPTQTFRVKTSLAYYGPLKKAWWSYLVIFSLLVFGAVLSLYVNYKFPDDEIRADLRKQMSQIQTDIRDLSMRLASRLRVIPGIELQLLIKRLKRLKWYTTDFDKERAEIADGTAKLGHRVTLVRLMGRLRESYESLFTLDVPPTIMDNLETGFEQLGNLLDDFQVADAELQDAETRLADMRRKIAGWSQADPTLAAQISSSLQSLFRDLQPTGALATSATFGTIRAQFTPLVTQLSTAPPNATDIAANDYYRYDSLAFRGNLLRKYVLLCDSRSPLPANSSLLVRRAELFQRMSIENWDGLRKARRLVEEMRQDVYSVDVKNEIIAQKVFIELDRNNVRAFQAAQFYLRFQDNRFDSAVALDEWSCVWNFGHGPFVDKKGDPNTYLEERGWENAHYFPKKETYHLTVRFCHEQDGELRDTSGRPIGPTKQVVVGAESDQPEFSGRFAWFKKWRAKAGVWMDGNGNSLLRLVLALIPAILGLVAGAKDEFLKMDLYLALIAIFLLGFGSDTVKNLLSQKPKT